MENIDAEFKREFPKPDNKDSGATYKAAMAGVGAQTFTFQLSTKTAEKTGLFRSNLTSPLLVRGPHYTHVYLLHAVYSQTLFTC